MLLFSPSIELVYPVKKKSKDEDMNTMERGFTLKGTLRGLGRNTLKKLRQGQSGGMSVCLSYLSANMFH
jgi:hypothetical protein